MAFVGAYEHDVFISYAHADNVIAGGGAGWVEQFATDFNCALGQRLGDPPGLDIFIDKGGARSNFTLNQLVEKASRSAVMIIIGSRTWVSHAWTVAELQAFAKLNNDSSRIFVVECLPLDNGERYPAPIDGHVRQIYWRRDEPTSNTPMPLSPRDDGVLFRKLVHDLAEHVRERLLDMVETPELPDAPPPPEPGTRRRVLIAQATDDLAEESDDLRRYLGQFAGEIEILPSGAYPQGGDEFSEAFAADLARADIFAQLLGPRPGRTSPDLAEGYTLHQAAAAAASGVKVLQWRRPGLRPSPGNEDAYQLLLAGEHVVEDSFESFKAMVLKAARTPPAPPPTPHAQGGFVFIDADPSDLEIAKQVQKEFAVHALSSVLPVMGATAEEIRTDLEENFVDCEAMILVYGSAAPVWVRSQLRLFNKVRARRAADPRLIAIYTGPPPEKPDHGVMLPYAREIDCRASWNLDKIRSIISELEQ